MLMPYWNYKIDLALNKPTQSQIFELISIYNENEQLDTNFADLAQLISEQILLQRNQSMDDKIYKLLENEYQWIEYKRAFELAEFTKNKNNAKILKLLLLVSIDIGLETHYEGILNIK